MQASCCSLFSPISAYAPSRYPRGSSAPGCCHLLCPTRPRWIAAEHSPCCCLHRNHEPSPGSSAAAVAAEHRPCSALQCCLALHSPCLLGHWQQSCWEDHCCPTAAAAAAVLQKDRSVGLHPCSESRQCWACSVPAARKDHYSLAHSLPKAAASSPGLASLESVAVSAASAAVAAASLVSVPPIDHAGPGQQLACQPGFAACKWFRV